MTTLPFLIPWKGYLGRLSTEAAATPIRDATWYTALGPGDGLSYAFTPGALAQRRYLSCDFLLDGNHLVVFALVLQEGEAGPAFSLSFGLLNQVSARMRFPLEAVNQNRWRYEREGAWLKPICSGDRVDLGKVDRMSLKVLRKSSLPVRWCMTPIIASPEEPAPLEEILLPKGTLLDEMGQSNLHQWPTRSRTTDEVTALLNAQLEAARDQRWPADFSRWGGWVERQLDATGFFRTHHDGERWWLVDPDGHPFWSSGLDCVRVDTEAVISGLEAAMDWLPDPQGEYAAAYEQHGPLKAFNFLAANLIRAFGKDGWYARWAEIARAELRRVGFNTVANWSDWQIASASGIPYVRPLAPTYQSMPQVYRDFPDVFHPSFAEVAAAFAEPLRQTAQDPAFIGYFLMNEPNWGFAKDSPAEGMLFNSPSCASRRAMADFLRQKYGDPATLSTAWGFPVTFAALQEGEWKTPLSPAARADLADFSEVMVEKFFGGLSTACRNVDPSHLNLGIRYYTIPPKWALTGMRHFDVFSMNCYRQRVPAEDMAYISSQLNMPIMIGEWHFGAMDAGLPAAGIGHVTDQEGRGKAFRFYLEDAAAKPWCVGSHYFILYDQSAVGRFDGENYNIGFLDVCNRPYELLARAARLSHERLYPVAAGQAATYDEQPVYLPLLFL